MCAWRCAGCVGTGSPSAPARREAPALDGDVRPRAQRGGRHGLRLRAASALQVDAIVRLIVDGFHRHRVGREVADIRESVRGRLPVTRIRAERSDEASRIAATIEHNRARGEHRISDMSEIVRMLYQAGWRDAKIQEELGMDPDEVRRLKQMTGLAELFAERQFSEAWEPED